MDSFALRLTEHGAARLDRAALSLVGPLLDILTPIAADRPGIRLHGLSGLSALLAAEGPIGSVAAASAGRPLQPVRAILFDKTAATNWALGWHQDRTIAVRERIEVAGYGPWTVKAGLTHVEPPFAVIERMLTLRVHLDAVPPDNAPLLVAPGSHRLGRIAEADIADVVERHGAVACLAMAGDIWAYATPILHASAASTRGGHRRVLQVDYSDAQLPSGLRWAGLDRVEPTRSLAATAPGSPRTAHIRQRC